MGKNPKEIKRNRARQWLYISNGIKKLFASWLFGIFILLLLIATFTVAWKAIGTFTFRIVTVDFFAYIVAYSFRISVLILILILLGSFLYFLGKPCRALEIEDDLIEAFKIPEEYRYRCPFLIERKVIKDTTVEEYIFWSKWIDLTRWNEPRNKKAILWALHIHSDEEFKIGKRKYTVTIHAGSGMEPAERETPKDPLFM